MSPRPDDYARAIGKEKLQALPGKAKPSEMFKESGGLDQFTRDHMRKWAIRSWARTSEEADARCARVEGWLSALEKDERDYWLNRGWLDTFEEEERQNGR